MSRPLSPLEVVTLRESDSPRVVVLAFARDFICAFFFPFPSQATSRCCWLCGSQLA